MFLIFINCVLVELETKDGVTRFVPISKNKKPQEESEATDVDLTVLALESTPRKSLQKNKCQSVSAHSICSAGRPILCKKILKLLT